MAADSLPASEGRAIPEPSQKRDSTALLTTRDVVFVRGLCSSFNALSMPTIGRLHR